MAQYGNYSKPSYGAQGGDDSGGFVYGGSQNGGGGSQGQGGGKAGYADESLRPVTVKLLNDLDEAYPGAEFAIDDRNITQITFVGQVRSIQPQSTNITYRIDDGTGTIDVKKWVDVDKVDDAGEGGGGAGTQFPLDSYVRIWGRLKSFNGKKHVSAHVIRPVGDYNEVNYHMLEVAYVHLLFTKGAPGGVSGGDVKMGDTSGDGGMFMDQNGGGQYSKVQDCSPSAQRVYKWLCNQPGTDNHISLITQGMGLSTRDVMTATEELMNHGMIYTTVDEDTFAVLEV